MKSNTIELLRSTGLHPDVIKVLVAINEDNIALRQQMTAYAMLFNRMADLMTTAIQGQAGAEQALAALKQQHDDAKNMTEDHSE